MITSLMTSPTTPISIKTVISNVLEYLDRPKIYLRLTIYTKIMPTLNPAVPAATEPHFRVSVQNVKIDVSIIRAINDTMPYLKKSLKRIDLIFDLIYVDYSIREGWH